MLGHNRLLLGLFLRTASATLLQCGRQHVGGQRGAIMVLHTWDQLWQAHFHLHALVPGGARAEDGPHWVPTHPEFLFPVKALGKVCRGKFLEACQAPALTHALCWNAQTAPLRTKAGCAHLLDHLYAQHWGVYAKRPFAGPEHVIESLGRSTHRVAIANNRIVDLRHGQVRFPYCHRPQGAQLQTMELAAHTFLRRF
jgi:hypothetical protein